VISVAQPITNITKTQDEIILTKAIITLDYTLYNLHNTPWAKKSHTVQITISMQPFQIKLMDFTKMFLEFLENKDYVAVFM